MKYIVALLAAVANVAQAQMIFDPAGGSAPSIYNQTVLPMAGAGVTPTISAVPIGGLVRTNDGALCVRIGSTTAAASFINLTSATVTIGSLGVPIAPIPAACKF